MRIRFDAARFAPFSWKESIDIPQGEVEELGLLALSPIDCRGSVTFVDPDFVLHGGLRYEQTAACDRCLKPVAIEGGAEIDLVLVERDARRRGARTEGETELAESDLGVVEVAGDSFETGPLVREQVALGVPTKPLCREDCRGLCPVCGIDRNEAECDCETRSVDPRWADLAALKGSLPGGREGGS